jgi:hypothetical protein
MAEPIGALRVEMSANKAQLDGDMRAISASVHTNANRMRLAMDTVSKSFNRGLSSLKTWGKYAAIGAVTGAAAGMVVLAKRVVATAEEFNALSQRTGITTESLSALAFTAEQSEMDLEGLVKGLRVLNKTAVDAAGGSKTALKAFAALGMTAKDLVDDKGGLKGADALLLELADRFKAMPEGPLKADAAMGLFSARMGTQFIPMLNLGTAGMLALNAQAKDLGRVISTDLGQAADDLSDQVNELKSGLFGFAIGIGVVVVPMLNDMIRAFKEARAEGDGLLEAIWKGAISRSPLGVMTDELADAQGELDKLVAKQKVLASVSAAQRERKIAPSETMTTDMLTAADAVARQTVEVNRLKDAVFALQAAEEMRKAAAKTKRNAGDKFDYETLQEQIDAANALLIAPEKASDAAEKAAEQALKSGEQAIEQMLRERDVREGSSRVQQLAFELEAGNLVALHLLRTQGTADQQKEAGAIEERLTALAKELDLRQMIQGIEDAMAANAGRATQIIDEGLSEADRLRAQLAEIDQMQKRLPTSLLVGGGLGSEKLLTPEQEAAARKRIQMALDAAVATEKYDAAMAKLRAGVAAGTVTQDEYRTELAAIEGTMTDAAEGIIAQWELVDRTFEDWSRRATDALTEFCMTGKLRFGDFARSIIADMLRIQIQSEMTKLFAGAASSGIAAWLFPSTGTRLGSIFSGEGMARGGTAKPGSMHEVVEQGPELLSTQGRHYLMMGNQGGQVTPLGADFASVLAAGTRSFLAAGGSPYAPAEMGRSEAAASTPQSIRIVNAIDPDLMSDWASSASGEKVILNTLARNRTQLKTLVRD